MSLSFVFAPKAQDASPQDLQLQRGASNSQSNELRPVLESLANLFGIKYLKSLLYVNSG
jgi:hypothetical protein